MLGNWFKTTLLMAAVIALFGIVGATLGGAEGMLIALLLGGGMNFFAYWFSDKMVLRMYGAREVDAASAPEYYATVRELAGRAGIPMPKVYVIDEAQPNAFATGRNPQHAAVAATTGILQLLTARELRGVMAHELAHVKHRDILTSTIAATMAGAISAIAHFGFLFGGRGDDRPNPIVAIVVMIMAPIAAMLIQFAISARARIRRGQRRRGNLRRSAGTRLALDKMERYAKGLPMPSGTASRDGADDDYQSVAWRRPRRVCSALIPQPPSASHRLLAMAH